MGGGEGAHFVTSTLHLCLTKSFQNKVYSLKQHSLLCGSNAFHYRERAYIHHMVYFPPILNSDSMISSTLYVYRKIK